MITINNIEYRNLEEQVQENKKRIEEHWNIDRVLADFGIRVLGTLTSVDQLPETSADYGDAYLVGTTAPYDIYIWTRANPNIDKFEDYWLNLGPIAIVGPQGLQGPEGPQGEQGIEGTKWFVTTTTTPPGPARVNDLWLNVSTGNVYKKLENGWELTKSLMGPQGIQGPTGPQGLMGPQGERGPQGLKGDIGGNFNILGSLASVDELPDPSTLNPHDAYIVGQAKDLYAQVGPEDNKVWENFGPLNVGTLVTVDGQYQNEWNADTKVDSAKSYMTSSSIRLYGVRGGVDVIDAPRANTDATEAAENANINLTTYDRYIGTDVQIYKGTIMRRDNNGTCSVLTPFRPKHITNKQYVDKKITDEITAQAVRKSSIVVPAGETPRLYGITSDNNSAVIQALSLTTYEPNDSSRPNEAGPDGSADLKLDSYYSTIMSRDSNGRSSILRPYNPKHIANKEYVDDTINKYSYWENTIVARTGANHIVLNIISHGTQGLNTTSTSSLSDFPETPCTGHMHNTNSPLQQTFPMSIQKISGVFYLTFWNVQANVANDISFTTSDIVERISTNITMPV